MIVLDASLAIAWLLREHQYGAADAYDLLAESSFVVPSHWPIEIGNALRSNLRSGRISSDIVDTIAEYLEEFDIAIEPPIPLAEIRPLLHFAVAHELTVYDATYVQLALQQSASLATVDAEMRQAAGKLRIPLLPA